MLRIDWAVSSRRKFYILPNSRNPPAHLKIAKVVSHPSRSEREAGQKRIMGQQIRDRHTFFGNKTTSGGSRRSDDAFFFHEVESVVPINERIESSEIERFQD